MKARRASHLVEIGDSLSDRSTMAKRKLAGVIPMDKLSGVDGTKSPLGRFGNGLVWSDMLAATIANQWLIEILKREGIPYGVPEPKPDTTDVSDAILSHDKNWLKIMKAAGFFPEIHVEKPPKQLFKDCTDLADAVIQRDRHVKKISRSVGKTINAKDRLERYIDIADAIIAQQERLDTMVNQAYTFKNDLYIPFRNTSMVRSYAEGGLTAHSWAWRPSKSIKRFFTRIIVSKLKKKRAAILDYDKEHALSQAHKDNTLVIEWSGANDLITVNARPSRSEVDLAIKARMKNLEILIQKGYCNFSLFNLPDLALTPRYQNNSEEERENAHRFSVYFNEQLAFFTKEMSIIYPHCSIEVFDVYELFHDIYENPEQFSFDKDKLTTPYLESEDFKIHGNKTSPAAGYMFYDDVHPTADAQALIAQNAYEEYDRKYRLKAPDERKEKELTFHLDEKTLRTSFIKAYQRKWHKQRHGIFGCCRNSNIDPVHASLEDILKHADGDTRTRKVLIELRWIDKAGELDLNIPLLQEVKARLDAEMQFEASLSQS